MSKTKIIKSNLNNVVYKAEVDEQGSILRPDEIGQGVTTTSRLQIQPRPIGETTNGECLMKKYQVPLKELSRMIGAMYCGTFQECTGACVVYNHGAKKFEVHLYFEPLDPNVPTQEGMIRNLLSKVETKGKNIIEQRQAVDNMKNGDVLELNQETKLLLAPDCYGGFEKNKNLNSGQWRTWTHNGSSTISNIPNYGSIPVMFGGQRTKPFIVFTGLHFLSVIRKLYGKKMDVSITNEEDGATVNYKETEYLVKYARRDPQLDDDIIEIDQINKPLKEAIANRLRGGQQLNGGYIAYR